jgi:uncharacterized membrane protein
MSKFISFTISVITIIIFIALGLVAKQFSWAMWLIIIAFLGLFVIFSTLMTVLTVYNIKGKYKKGSDELDEQNNQE